MRRTDRARPKTWMSPDDAECSKCGRIHTRQTCPAQDKTCHKCGKPNHFAPMCRSTAPIQRAAVRQKKRPQRVHAINDADYNMSDQESTIGCLSASVNTVHSGGQPYTTLHIGCESVPMEFKVDTLSLCAVESHPTPGDSRGSSSPSRSIPGIPSHVADGGSARTPLEGVQPSLSWSSYLSRSIHSPEHRVILHPFCSHHVPKVA